MSNSVTVWFGNGDGTFQGQADYPTGILPSSVAAADLNGDRVPDLAISVSATNSVLVRLGNGDGTFGEGIEFAVGSEPQFIVAGDINGDGQLDLAVANSASNNLSLLYNNTLPCTALSVTATVQSLLSPGGTSEFRICAPPTFNWTTTSNAGWMTVDSGGTGSGSGVSSLSIGANAGDVRVGSATVSGSTESRTIHIIQRGASTTQLFGDVPFNHAFFDYITLLRERNVTAGCSLNPPLYCPDSTTTRGQMAAFIIRAKLGDSFSFRSEPYFPLDVPPQHTYFRYVQKMAELGITTGCAPQRYCPDNPVTRGQMAVFIVRAKMGDVFASPSTLFFIDVPARNQFFRYIQKMRELGITSGCTANQYCPESPVTRGQMAPFIIRGFFSVP